MEADLKVGCLRTVLDYDLQIEVWDVRVQCFGGGKASQIFRYHSHLSPGAQDNGDIHLFAYSLWVPIFSGSMRRSVPHNTTRA
jgi:hypothetical protein